MSFTVGQGETFGIVGGNGAGKTTTVECLQGLRDADEGRIVVLGRPVRRGARPNTEVIGSQLQDAALPDRLRVREALRLFARDRSRTRIDDILRAWGLDEHARTPFARLSGGLQQRLFIALALVDRPRLVFLDELTRGLDPHARRTVWDAIRQLRRDGTTVVLVTHAMDEAEALCDRIAVFRAGTIVATGTPSSIVSEHAPNATITFTGAALPALAALAGVSTVRHDGDGMHVECASAAIPYVCAALLESGAPPADLHVRHPTLEDAILALERDTRP